MFFSPRSVLLPSPCCFIDASALAPFPFCLLPLWLHAVIILLLQFLISGFINYPGPFDILPSPDYRVSWFFFTFLTHSIRSIATQRSRWWLKDNCGSVTPGVLRFIVPLMERSIRAVSLGLSYSLMDADVFLFLRNLHGLESAELYYYWVRVTWVLHFIV